MYHALVDAWFLAVPARDALVAVRCGVGAAVAAAVSFLRPLLPGAGKYSARSRAAAASDHRFGTANFAGRWDRPAANRRGNGVSGSSGPALSASSAGAGQVPTRAGAIPAARRHLHRCRRQPRRIFDLGRAADWTG